jgi:hypothetical protein
MNSLQQHIIELEQKVDRLYRIVERLSRQVATFTVEQQSPPLEETNGYLTPLFELIGGETYSEGQWSYGLENRELLIGNSEGQLLGRELPPSVSTDVQVRRLTAQLTAAYNQIAALEEQLVACRIHP